MADILQITKAVYDEELKGSGRPALLFFSSQWCQVCKGVRPHFREVAERFAGDIVFGEVDILAEGELPIELDVLTIPTVLLVRGGADLGRLTGGVSGERIVELLKKAGVLHE